MLGGPINVNLTWIRISGTFACTEATDMAFGLAAFKVQSGTSLQKRSSFEGNNSFIRLFQTKPQFGWIS